MGSNENGSGFDFDGFEAIPLRVTVRVGAAQSTLGRLTSLGIGQVIELDRRIGEPFDLLANGRLLGRVEPVASGDGVAVKLVEVPEDDDVPGC